jgi:hypothetical protein
MPYTMEDFLRDVALEHLHLLTPDERCRGLSAEELRRGLSAEELCSGLSAEELLKGLTVDERLEGIPIEVVEDYLRKLCAEELKTQPEV